MAQILEPPTGADSKERRRLMLLAEAGMLAARDLGESELLKSLAEMVVAEVGEWCSIDVLRDVGVERVAIETALESNRPVRDYFADYPPRLDLPSPLKDAIDTRTTQRVFGIPDEMIDQFAEDEKHAQAIRDLGIASGAVVPLVSRDKVLGALAVASSADFPPLDDDDLTFLEEIARRGAEALDRSRLFSQISAAEERFRSILSHVGAVVWECDTTEPYLVRFVGSSVTEMIGWEPSERERISQALLPESSQRAALIERLRSEGSAEFEKEVSHADGRLLWVTTQVVLDQDRDGEEVLRGVTVDSTDRRLRERQVEAELAIARVLASASSPQEIPERVMRSMLDALDWDAAGLWLPESGSVTCATFVTKPADLAPNFKAKSRGLRFESGVGLPGQAFKEGEPIWIEDLSQADNFPRAGLAATDGLRSGVAFVVRARGAVQCVIEMFSTRPRTEDPRLMRVMDALGRQVGQIMERRRLDLDLAENEHRLRSMVASAIDAVVGMDDAGIVTDFNPAAEKVFGYSRTEAIGRRLAELIIPPALRQAHAEGLQRLVRTGESRIVGKRLEVTGMRSDGSEFPMELAVTEIRRSPRAFVGFVRDLSVQRSVETRREAQFEVTKILAASTSSAQAFPELLKVLGERLGWPVGVAWRQRDTAGLKAEAVWVSEEIGFAAPTPSLTPIMPVGEGLLGRVFRDGAPLWIEDLTEASGYLRADAAEEVGLRSAVMFPVVVGDRPVGVIEFYDRSRRRPDEDLLRTLAAIGRQIGGFVERTTAIEQMRLHRAILSAQTEASIEGVLVVAASDRVLSRNSRFDQMFGLSRSHDDLDGRQTLTTILSAGVRGDGADQLLLALQDDQVELREDLELKDGRAFEVYTVPLRSGPADPPIGRAWFFRDISDRRHTEELIIEASRRSAFLAELGTALIRTMDRETLLEDSARVAMPVIGDRCTVDLVDERGALRRISVLERGRDGVIRRQEGDVLHPAVGSVLAQVMDSRSVEIASDAGAEAEGAFPWRPLPETLLCVPFHARGRFLGAITFALDRPVQMSDPIAGLARDLSERVSIALDRASLYLDRSRVAATLQDSLLPPALPEIPGLRVAARYLPARAEIDVGGDFYDVFEAGRKDWTFVIGDVCGKGAEAAALTALTRHTIRATVLRTRRPRLVLSRVNEALVKHGNLERFATVAYVRVRPRDDGAWRLNIALGGHPSPWVIRTDGTVGRLGVPGTLLGALSRVHLEDAEEVLQRGDRLVMLTDGVLEARDEAGEQFGEDRLAKVLQENSDLSPDDIAAKVVAAARDFQDGLLRDDIAILVVEAE